MEMNCKIVIEMETDNFSCAISAFEFQALSDIFEDFRINTIPKTSEKFENIEKQQIFGTAYMVD